MKILVTGGSGFLGSHIADELTEQGHDVTIFDMIPSPYLQPQQKMIVGDILDVDALARAMQNMDVVYHFAALANTNEAREKPKETVECNITGTLNALEAARKNKIKRFVFGSTLYVFSSAGSFYSTSKKACELLVQNYFQEYELKYTILRYGSVYGPRGKTNSSVYKLLMDAVYTGKIKYRGTGEEIREYVYVKDAAKISGSILSEEYVNKAITITGPQRIQYRELLSTINEILGNKIEIKYEASHDPLHYKLTPYSFNPDEGKKLVCNPSTDFAQGLINCVREIYEQKKKED